MHCQNCGARNATEGPCCDRCGVPLPTACGACFAINPPEANYCCGCGCPLPSAVDERRHVTLLFADIKGATEMIQGHGTDPERVKQLLAPVIAIMRASAERYGGQVDRIPLGDAIMAVFGAPQALEDHAVRACLAALSLQAAIDRWNKAVRADRRGLECQVRVGLNSGEILTSPRVSDGHYGEATILASRLESLAEPGQVLLGRSTWQLARGFIRGRSLGLRAVKGKSEPIEVFELEGMEARSRFHARQNQGLSRFVGRDGELATLRRAFAAAAAGNGQVVTVTGNPGVGKSRLLHHFIRYVIPSSGSVIEATAEPYDREALWVPIANLIRAGLSIGPSDESATIRAKLEERLTGREALLAATVLLDVASPAGLRAWGELDAAQRRRRIGDAVRTLVFDGTDIGVSVVLVDDVQWLDDDARTLLTEFIEDVRGRRVLLLVGTREEAKGGSAHHTVLSLAALDRDGTSLLLSHLVGRSRGISELREWVLERSDDQPTPLFIEETVSALVEQGALAGSPGDYRLCGDLRAATQAIPLSIEAVLAARIDRLSRVHKDVLEAAAVIGMEMPVELLGAVARVDVQELVPVVRDLEVADLMFESLTYGHPECRFKHTLTREVTATRIPSPRRRDLHARTIAAVENLYHHRRLEWVDRLADHASRAELWAEAAAYYVESCRRAIERSASRQAVAFAERSLEMLRQVPPDEQSARAEVDVRLLSINALLPLGEQERIAATLQSARQLAVRIADRRRLAKVETQLALYLWQTGRHEEALRSGNAALEIAAADNLPHISCAARLQIGIAYHALGRFERSLQFHKAVIAELQEAQGDRGRVSWAADPAVVARAFSADSHLCLGMFSDAAALLEEGSDLTTDLEDRYGRALIDAASGRYHLTHDAPEVAAGILERAEAQCVEFEVHTMLPAIVSVLGTAYVRSGQVARALDRLRDALNRQIYLRAGNYTFFYLLMALAEAEWAAGQLADALKYVDEAERLVRTQCEHGHHAQALFLKASITARHSAAAASEQFEQALRWAERCGMRPLVADCLAGLALTMRDLAPDRARELATSARTLYLQLGLGRRAAQGAPVMLITER